ncbi:hypothetical protein BU24DRAFT_494283 [Aaosphaeria arxii CBS 175.79]|uniref:T6SS Phospholipase effector Tle1-like catalytic domain-containing protein n=1 Tax=Aaosphaeria arxii CBS 175.79 TaxID=1450172 RepID=A0A6A5XL80_9PLEO|nr:uncharacterized protein BU24DRAFT_494283 [Aaosphaeria arxii CBS 175.79]KAF2013902.1 hypothetical protein BU24DRAFT_494283 [Aaosphaeria arxii CBS 175.79]
MAAGSQSLFILCDGTGQDGIQKHKSTHVTRFKECLKKQRRSGQRQNPRYIEGIGTNGWGKGSVDRLTGGSIHESILRAYDDLCTKYRPGDEIHLVGFSRGAMVVRSLACFICEFGILRIPNSSIQLQAYEYWLNRKHTKLNDLAAILDYDLFRDVPIETCAVWDTVSSLRFTSSLQFVEERVPRNLRCGFQALALHECRTEFMPVLWNASTSTRTIIKQTWFMGDHSDIGGGHSDDSGLANFSLLWMLSQFGETTNVEFDEQVVLKLMTPGFYYKDSFSVDSCYTEGALHGDDSHKPLWQKPKARMELFNSEKRVLLWQNRPQRPRNRAQIPARIEANTISAFTEYNVPLATVGESINTATASAKANTTIHFTAALMIQKLSYKPGLLENMELRAVEKPGAGCCRAWIDPELRRPFGIWEDRSTKWEDWMFRQWIKREEKCYGPEESDLGLSLLSLMPPKEQDLFLSTQSPIRSTLSGTFDALYRMRIAPYQKEEAEIKRFTATLYRFRNSNNTRSTRGQVRQTSSCDGLDTALDFFA